MMADRKTITQAVAREMYRAGNNAGAVNIGPAR